MPLTPFGVVRRDQAKVSSFGVLFWVGFFSSHGVLTPEGYKVYEST